jgi:hypothetical protein
VRTLLELQGGEFCRQVPQYHSPCVTDYAWQSQLVNSAEKANLYSVGIMLSWVLNTPQSHHNMHTKSLFTTPTLPPEVLRSSSHQPQNYPLRRPDSGHHLFSNSLVGLDNGRQTDRTYRHIPSSSAPSRALDTSETLAPLVS